MLKMAKKKRRTHEQSVRDGKKAHDMTLTAGIRRAMQDYIDKHPS